MCEFCRQAPCDNRCPNAENPELIIMGMCDRCQDYIYLNNTYWTDFDGNKFCSRDCAEEYYGLQEVDE